MYKNYTKSSIKYQIKFFLLIILYIIKVLIPFNLLYKTFLWVLFIIKENVKFFGVL
jgi:hypothetical protein